MTALENLRQQLKWNKEICRTPLPFGIFLLIPFGKTNQAPYKRVCIIRHRNIKKQIKKNQKTLHRNYPEAGFSIEKENLKTKKCLK